MNDSSRLKEQKQSLRKMFLKKRESQSPLDLKKKVI